jgi:hypothetical protein
MANTNAPFGFRQYQGTGSAPTYEQVVMTIDKDDTSAVYYGDPVVPLNTGYVAKGTPSNLVQVAGIFYGCKYLSTSQKRVVWSNYWPGSDASDDVEAYVVNDPNAKFLAQTGNSSSTGLVFGDINANVQFAYGTGNSSTGISGAYIDIAVTPNTTATYPFRVVSLVTQPPGGPGTEAGAYNYAVVAFNNASTKQLTSVG